MAPVSVTELPNAIDVGDGVSEIEDGLGKSAVSVIGLFIVIEAGLLKPVKEPVPMPIQE
jgi:hypothetical protein